MKEQFTVTCTLANAADKISGYQFEPGKGGKVASGVSRKDAERFAGIPGYIISPSLDGEKTTADDGPDYAGMPVGDLVALLEKEPEKYEAVGTAESAKKKPRPGVLAAVEQAKAKWDGKPTPPDNANPETSQTPREDAMTPDTVSGP